MLGHRHFYNRTIRKIVVAFGSLFNDLEIIRYSKDGQKQYERIRVPLSYGPKEKYITRLASDPTLTKSINVSLPRISFNMEGLQYDSSRKQISTTRNFAKTSTGINSQYVPIPYSFDFSLSIYVRNTEDGTQLIEQILPFFTPDFTVTVDLMSGMEQKYDMPITLNSATPEVDYEGDFLSTRMIVWTLNFTIKSFIFPPMQEYSNNMSGLIRTASTNVYINTNMQEAQKVFVDFANGSGVLTTGETIRVLDKPITGTVTYFSNNSTGVLIVENLTDLLDDNDVIRGDYSNAVYTIDAIDWSPIKAFTIITTPDPIDAQPNDDYGFTETITEYPLTLVTGENIKDITTEDGNKITTENSLVIETEI
jgi:hypothetical protein